LGVRTCRLTLSLSVPLGEAQLRASACLGDGTSPRSLPLPDSADSRNAFHAYRLGPAWDAGSVARCSAEPEGDRRPFSLAFVTKSQGGGRWRCCGVSPLLSSRRGCGVSPSRPLLRPSTASCTCAHVCSAWPALRAPKSCLPRISVSPTSRTRDVSVLTWGSSSFSIVRLLRAHDDRVTVSFPCLEPLGLLGFPPWQPGRLWPSRLQRGWMRPVPGFTRRPSPLSHRSLN